MKGYKIEELTGKLEKGLAIVQCAMSYACDTNDAHFPYLEPALSVAVDLLESVKSGMDGLLEQADKEAQ